jgi:protein-disulfide isomerase
MLHRRTFLSASVGLAVTPLVSLGARADLRREPVELVSQIDRLRGKAILGARAPDVTLYEFFDYNCGYCRQSAAEIPSLLKGDPNLRYVLVNFAVLSQESILAHRVALAFLKQKPGQYFAFHQRLFAKRGLRGGEEAVEAALSLGANEKQLVAESNTKATTNALVAAVQLGDSLGFTATPSYVAGAQANVGFLDLDRKKAAVAAMRTCERMVCG